MKANESNEIEFIIGIRLIRCHSACSQADFLERFLNNRNDSKKGHEGLFPSLESKAFVAVSKVTKI